MIVNKYKILRSNLGKQIDIPIEIKWDLYGQDDDLDKFQEQVVEDAIGKPKDFELARFQNKQYANSFDTSVNYEFNFYNGNPNNVETSTPANWTCSYLPEGFTASEVYYYEKPFTKSFFKLDFYDSNSGTNQTNYFTVILPVQQGSTESVSISPTKPNVNIKKPSQFLDYVGDKEGFFFYWLRKKEFIDISTFYMTAKFFDARLGVFVKMMTVPQSTLPDVFLFNGEDKFYYKVVLDSVNQTYKIFNISNGLRVGEGTPIKWYEYINP